MHRHPVTMADAVTPANIPAKLGCAAAYVNGEFEWTRQELARFPRVIRISVLPDPKAAAKARALDVENHDATPADAPAFVRYRQGIHHRDATIYCNRSTLPAVLEHLGDLQPRLWIATLDGRAWTPDELAIDIAAAEKIPVSPERIWAVQYVTLAPGYDLSLVYGEHDFDRR